MTTKKLNPCLECGNEPSIMQSELTGKLKILCSGCGTNLMYFETAEEAAETWNEVNPSNVYEVVKKALERMGADGLVNDECGCGFDDFAPCGECNLFNCQPGFSAPASEINDVDFLYFPTRRGAEEAAAKTKEQLLKETGL